MILTVTSGAPNPHRRMAALSSQVLPAHRHWRCRTLAEAPRGQLPEGSARDSLDRRLARAGHRRSASNLLLPCCLGGAVVVSLLARRRRLGAKARRRRRAGIALYAVSQDSGGDASPDEVEVVSYNVLSSHLSQPWYFWHNNPEDLDPKTRLKRVLEKLKPMVQRGAIICLQETSMDWTSFLHAFFQRRGYYFVHSLYGKPFNGYMGVGIAFPSSRYDLGAVSIQRVSDVKAWVQSEQLGSSSPRSGNQKLLDVAGYFASPLLFQRLGVDQNEGDDEQEQLAVDPWEYSRTRQNTMVSLKLRPRRGENKPFVVSTYHMPCAYWAPKVMVIHAALAAQCALRFARDEPLVLAGDWNFKPGAAPYELLTTGALPEAHPAHPGHREGETWRVDQGLQSLRSAYAERNPGGEPEFTNYAWTKEDLDPFIGTIDYIFVSKSAEILSVGKLPAIRTCPSPLPTSEEPSDHLMLSARLRPHGKPPKEVQQARKGGLSRPAHTRKLKDATGGDSSGSASGTGTRAGRGFRPSSGSGFGGFGKRGGKAGSGVSNGTSRPRLSGGGQPGSSGGASFRDEVARSGLSPATASGASGLHSGGIGASSRRWAAVRHAVGRQLRDADVWAPFAGSSGPGSRSGCHFKFGVAAGEPVRLAFRETSLT